MKLRTQEGATPEPGTLLRSYLTGKNREKAFTQLSAHYASLIYSSALRRCGNRSLAEEVTQNVLTLLARKASTLSKHPNLTAWVYQTTRLETVKAMRAEQRRSKKHANYGQDPLFSEKSSLEPEEQAAWCNLLPHLDSSLDRLSNRDRELILNRFFEKKKFKDIARDLGGTEGACKMQLKRALERLGVILKSHGSSLPVTTISSGLLASLAATTPSKAATALASQALSNSSAVSASSALTNTILTMTNTQKVTTLSILLITATSIPAVQMGRESARLQSQLQVLESRSLALTRKFNNEGGTQTSRRPERSVGEIFAGPEGGLDGLTLLKQLSTMEMMVDTVGFLRVVLPIVDMEEEQLAQLLREVQVIDGYARDKDFALMLIATAQADKEALSYQKRLEDSLSAGDEGWSSRVIIQSWAEKEPEQALAWFREQEANGSLAGKGVLDSTESYFDWLLAGIYENSPSQALEVYWQSNESFRENAQDVFSKPILSRYEQSGDLSELRDFLAQEEDSELRKKFLNRAFQSADSLPQLLEMNKLEEWDFKRLVPAISKQDWAFEEKVVALEDNLSQKDFEENLKNVFYEEQNQEEAFSWIQEQPEGPQRDGRLSALSDVLSRSKENRKAYEVAQEIADEGVRGKILLDVSRRWYRANPKLAQETIAPEILEEIR